MVLAEERETHISKINGEDFWRVYTTDSRYIRKLDKITDAVEVTYQDGEVFSKTYKLTEKQLLLRNEPKKRELSEEQKLALTKRLRGSDV